MTWRLMITSTATIVSPQQKLQKVELPCTPAPVSCRDRWRDNRVAWGTTGGYIFKTGVEKHSKELLEFVKLELEVAEQSKGLQEVIEK